MLRLNYRKNPNIWSDHPKIWKRWLYHRVIRPKDADGMANSEDPDQTRSSLIWVYTVCPDLSVQKFRNIVVCLSQVRMTILIFHYDYEVFGFMNIIIPCIDVILEWYLRKGGWVTNLSFSLEQSSKLYYLVDCMFNSPSTNTPSPSSDWVWISIRTGM